MVEKHKLAGKKAAFFLLAFLTLCPIFVFLFTSAGFHSLYDMPKVTHGVLDLQGMSLRGARPLPLDGEWEFYKGHWMLAEGGLPAAPDLVVAVPSSWEEYPNLHLPSKGIGTYRILLKNCPPGEKLLVQIPGINSRYRAYLNGVPVSGRGNMNIMPRASGHPVSTDESEYQSVSIAPGDTAELVIELASPHIGGLYKVPFLTEQEANHVRTDSRNMFSAGFIGVLVVTIGSFAFLLVLRDRLLSSYALLLGDVLVFMRILFQNNYLSALKKVIPLRDYTINNALQMVTLLLPIVFLISIHQLVSIKLSRKTIRFTAFYSLMFMPAIFYAIFAGKPFLVFLLSVGSYLPFFYVMWMMYKSVCNGAKYSLEIAGVQLLLIAGTLVSALADSGQLIIEVSLFAPACLMLSMVLQLAIFLRRSIDMQHKAIEAENLQLRLKESQSDLMLSQIKPHFLYNTLLAIHMLCTIEPETAAETILKFATFLRTNLNFSANHKLIPFQDELTHTRNYVDIEQLRYQKRLSVRYEIGPTDFLVPTLSVQPLVENAIRHGVCKSINGGTVVLKTWETNDAFCIEVQDDGVGFDTVALAQAPAEPHGLQNVEFRLRTQCAARLTIVSEIDHGTAVTIYLPKEMPHEDSAGR